MNNNPYNNNANTNVYFLNAKINGPETAINPYSTLPPSSTGNQIPVFLAASSSTGGQYAATLPQQANVTRQQTHEVLNEHKTHCACTDLPNTQNSAVGEVPVKLNSPNYSGPYATLPQPIQNFAGNIPVVLNVRHGQRQPFHTGNDPSSMMSMVDPNGVGGWYPAVNVVRTRVKESELQNMINWPIIPETQEVLDARPPQNSGTGAKKSNKKKKKKTKKKAKKSKEEEADEGGDEEEPSFSGVAIKHFRQASAVLCLFAFLSVAAGVTNLIIYILFGIDPGRFVDWCSSPYNHTGMVANYEKLDVRVGIVWSGIGILALPIFVAGAITFRVRDPSKTKPAIILCFISAIIALIITAASALSVILSFPSTAPTLASFSCLTILIISAAVGLLGVIEFFMTIIMFAVLHRMAKQARTQQKSKSKKKKVKKGKRDVVSAAPKKEVKKKKKGHKKGKKRSEELVSESEAEEDEGHDDDDDDDDVKECSDVEDEEEEEESGGEENNNNKGKGRKGAKTEKRQRMSCCCMSAKVEKNKKGEDEEEEDEDDEEEDDEEEEEQEASSSEGEEDDEEDDEDEEEEEEKPKHKHPTTHHDAKQATLTKHPSTLPATPPAIQRPVIPYAPPGPMYAGYMRYPANQAMIDHRYMWGQYHPFRYNGMTMFNPARF